MRREVADVPYGVKRLGLSVSEACRSLEPGRFRSRDRWASRRHAHATRAARSGGSVRRYPSRCREKRGKPQCNLPQIS